MRPRFEYPSVMASFFGVISFLIYFTEHSRIYPHLASAYLGFKILYSVLGLAFAFRFYRYGISDGWAVGFMTLLLGYCLTFMWFTPMYEAAYFECAIGCCFLKLRRPWIFTVTWGIGLVAVLGNYAIQESIGWHTPPAARADWIWILVIFFFLSALIHNFAVSVGQKEKEKLARFSLIGMESSRLIHDLKGMFSTPLLIAQSLRSRGRDLQPEVFESQMVALSHEMEHMREVLKSINRLVVVDDSVAIISLAATLHAPMRILENRLKHVTVVLPDDRKIQGNTEKLQSIFFNLFLNALEAFEANRSKDPRIEMGWRKDSFYFCDNAGGITRKADGTGLGLQLVRADLEKIGASFKMYSEEKSTTVEIKFR